MIRTYYSRQASTVDWGTTFDPWNFGLQGGWEGVTMTKHAFTKNTLKVSYAH